MPAPVRIAQVLMFIVAGLTAVQSALMLITFGASTETLAEVTWFALPGVAALVLALLIPARGARLRWMIISLQLVYVLLSLARLGTGDQRGLANLIIPIAVLALVTRREAKTYFRREAASP